MGIAELLLVMVLALETYSNQLSDSRIEQHIERLNNEMTVIDTELKDYQQSRERINNKRKMIVNRQRR